jgi:hypothetical protein
MMNPLSWSREHQLALLVAALIGAALATVLGYLVYASGWGEGAGTLRRLDLAAARRAALVGIVRSYDRRREHFCPQPDARADHEHRLPSWRTPG